MRGTVAAGFDGSGEAELLEALARSACRSRAAPAQRSRGVAALAAALDAGAFRADVSGAGPCVYGLFADRAEAERRLEHSRARGTWVTAPLSVPAEMPSDYGSDDRLVVEHREPLRPPTAPRRAP